MRPSFTDTITQSLIEMIDEAPDGARLPTVRELMARYGVGQATVQDAFTTLREKGLITSRVGRGSFVVKPGSRGDEVAQRLPRGGFDVAGVQPAPPTLERRAQVLDRAVDSRPCIAQERIGVPSVVRQVHVVDECAEWRAQSVQQRREDDTIGSNGGSR